MRLLIFPLISVACTACVVAGCAVGTDSGSDPLGNVEQEERWSYNDNPSLFDSDLVYELDALPREGEAEIAPWPGYYWATYQDSINHRWDGASSESPAAKYGTAFKVSGLENAVSSAHGIDSQDHRTACTTNADCDSDVGESCAKRHGQEQGRCIPTWFGLCHGWAPAAILEPEPVNPVTRNGVTFKVNDIKALMTLLYTRTNTKFLSSRCNENDGEDGMTYDEYGRPEARCRDTNPGTFHVVAANYLGLRHQAFAEDRTFDDEVWNQPVRSFRVLSMREVTATEANELVGATAQGGTSETFEGDVAKDQWSHHGPFPVAAGSVFKAVMSGTEDADLYVHFGAQPTSSAYTCRPYANGSDETCDLIVPDGATQAFVSVSGYAERSHYELDVTHGAHLPTSYVFNSDAVSLRHVRTELRYITESAASTDGNLQSRIDSYTRTDRYEYVLEVDAQGRVIGGEWVGDSKRNHPDFLWLPLSHKDASTVGGKITYANVKSLLDESVAGTEPTNQTVTVNENGTVTKDQWLHFGPFEAGNGPFVVKMTGTDDADLYVRKGSQPTTSAYDCRPYVDGSDETCNQVGPGTFYVSVRGYDASSTFSLAITYATAGGDPGPAPTPVDVDEAGTIEKDAWHHFGPFSAAAASAFRATLTPASGDADLYVRIGAQPTSSAYDCRPYHGGQSVETCPLDIDASQAVYVSVNGWAASSDYALRMTYTPAAAAAN